jgi:tetratricopeptide (TPR) repeat protein/fluoride ion exporter CrcB/FEX
MTFGRELRFKYLAAEALLILVGSYLLFFGGTLNGLVLPQIMSVTLWLVGGVSLAWFGWHALRRRWVETPPLWMPATALVLAYALTGLTSMDPRRSLNAAWVLLLELWIFLLVYDLVRHGWPREMFVKVLLLLGAIVVGFGLWQLVDWERRWLSVAGLETPLPPIWLRPAPFYAHANLVASFVNMLWPLALVWLWQARSRLTRLWCGLLIVGTGLVVLFCSSRGALLGAGGALGVMAVLALSRSPAALRRFKTWWMGSRWQAVLVIVVAVGVAGGLSTFVFRLLMHPTHGPVSSARTVFWLIALDAFRRSPLVGSGPDTYASNYLLWQSVPPQSFYVRAHSIPMQLAAETGLAGLAAGAWLMGALVVAAYRRWRTAQQSNRYLVVGLCGSLTTIALHSLVDTPAWIPAIAMTFMMLVALLLAEPVEQPTEVVRRKPAGTIVGALAAFLIVGSGIWMQYAYGPYFLGAAFGNASRWADALPLLEEATRRDPAHAYYHLQAGFAYGMSAFEGRREHLPQAIAHYRQGISHEPYFSPNHANLAALLWEQGERQVAIEAMKRAAELAPEEAAYPLNLGVFYERQGDMVRAIECYRHALTLRPSWTEAYFWRANAVRRAVLEDWQGERSVEPSSHVLDVVQSGDATEVLARFEQVSLEHPADATAHLRRAVALIALERWEEAEQALRVAEFVAQGGGSATPEALRNDIAYYQAVVAYERGHVEEAIDALECVLDRVRRKSFFGVGGEEVVLYGWGVFYRVGWGEDALPGLEIICFTDSQVDRLLVLGRWYESIGDEASARRVYREALEVAPDTVEAAERLVMLTP